jgi:hypothetical protein
MGLITPLDAYHAGAIFSARSHAASDSRRVRFYRPWLLCQPLVWAPGRNWHSVARYFHASRDAKPACFTAFGESRQPGERQILAGCARACYMRLGIRWGCRHRPSEIRRGSVLPVAPFPFIELEEESKAPSRPKYSCNFSQEEDVWPAYLPLRREFRRDRLSDSTGDQQLTADLGQLRALPFHSARARR